jgi:hypothetical protein
MAKNGLFYVLRSRQHLETPKSDKMAKNGLFYVLRSRQHLETVFFTFYEAANT